MERLKGMRVFLVEDESLVAMLVEEYLDELGCVLVASAARLPEALEQARDVAVDVALLDVNLAGEASTPVAEALSARGIPLVFTTGYGAGGLPEGMRDRPVLCKPFGLEQLGGALLALAGAGVGSD